jgi:hypothetical protein
MPAVFRRTFLHIPVSGREENIAVENPIGGVPDCHFLPKYSANDANFTARESIQIMTKCQQIPADKISRLSVFIRKAHIPTGRAGRKIIYIFARRISEIRLKTGEGNRTLKRVETLPFFNANTDFRPGKMPITVKGNANGMINK